MRMITAFFMAWGNFFAVPCPVKLWDNNLRRLQLVFFPIIGLLSGFLWYTLFTVMAHLNVSYLLAGAVMAGYPFFITGFIHLDGFMDCSDALLSRREPEEKQRILKDSHVGAFAVICVVLLFMFSYAAMASVMMETICESAREYADLWMFRQDGALKETMGVIILTPFVSRICSAISVLGFPPMGHSQYKASFDLKENAKYIVILSVFLVVALAVSVLYVGSTVPVFVAITGFLVMKALRKELGGMSGDVAGYGLTLAECMGMVLLAI